VLVDDEDGNVGPLGEAVEGLLDLAGRRLRVDD
jgi:hypothetical protein